MPLAPQADCCTKDTVLGKSLLRDVYLAEDPAFGGRITVPLLYDKRERRIVNNESSEIIRMLNGAFNEFSCDRARAEADYYPEDLRVRIDEVNSWVYE